MNIFAGQEQKHRTREWMCGHEGEGESGMNWENRFDINTLPCVKQITSKNLLYKKMNKIKKLKHK